MSFVEKEGDQLKAYLDSFLSSDVSNPRRIECCGSSRALYCPECCRLLVPENERPESVRDGKLKLPFELHVVLNDRRTSATGLHAVALLGGVARLLPSPPECDGDSNTGNVRLIDTDHEEEIPKYSKYENAFLLFPSEDSVPLSSIESMVSTLVVLDCRWTRSSIRLHPEIASLPKVRLSSPPDKSCFWRWHNAGQCCLSTIEAIYFAALELAPEEDHDRLLNLMWIFALQRAAIIRRGIWKDRVGLPFTEKGKDEMRSWRVKKAKLQPELDLKI